MARTTIEWVAPDGSITNLNDWQELFLLNGQRNFHNLPISINSYEVPLRPGEAFSSVEIKAREVDLPIFILSRTRADFIAKMRALVSMFNPDKGEGRLRVKHYDSQPREIYCRYRAGLEGQSDGSGWSPGSAKVILTFRASDPFFYDLNSQTASYVLGAPLAFFPFFPLRLSQSGIFTEPTLTNNGDHTAFPIWTITGPGDYVTLRNLTTGYELNSSISIPAATVLTIDTRLGYKTVTMNGQSYFSSLASNSVLWGLQRGANALQLILNNADSNSKIEVSFRPPYFGV